MRCFLSLTPSGCPRTECVVYHNMASPSCSGSGFVTWTESLLSQTVCLGKVKGCWQRQGCNRFWLMPNTARFSSMSLKHRLAFGGDFPSFSFVFGGKCKIQLIFAFCTGWTRASVVLTAARASPAAHASQLVIHSRLLFFSCILSKCCSRRGPHLSNVCMCMCVYLCVCAHMCVYKGGYVCTSIGVYNYVIVHLCVVVPLSFFQIPGLTSDW